MYIFTEFLFIAYLKNEMRIVAFKFHDLKDKQTKKNTKFKINSFP